MTRPGWLLLVLGLLLGPLYWAWCEHLSGERGQRYTLTERADRWVLPDGSIQRFRGGLAHRPAPLELDPSMNRIRLRLTFEFPEGRGPAAGRNPYQATLLDADHPLLTRTVGIDADAGGSRSVTVATFEVYAPGQYVFVLEELGVPASVPQTVTLETMVRAEQLSKPLLWSGLALLLAGLGLLTWDAINAYAGKSKGR